MPIFENIFVLLTKLSTINFAPTFKSIKQSVTLATYIVGV